MSETKKLQGKVAVITGGTTGIGLAAARLFVKAGAYVYITGRRQKELDGAVKEIGSNVIGVHGDIAKLTDLDRLYEVVRKRGESMSFSPMPALLNLLHWKRSRRSISTDYSTSMLRERCSRYKKPFRS